MNIKNLFFGALVSCVCATVLAGDIYVIAGPDVQLGDEDVRDVFLGQKQFAGSTKLAPVDNGPAQEDFVSKVLGMTLIKYGTAWTKKSFREGINPPPVKSGDVEVIDFVKRNNGAIGYVTTPPSGVTVIKKY